MTLLEMVLRRVMQYKKANGYAKKIAVSDIVEIQDIYGGSYYQSHAWYIATEI